LIHERWTPAYEIASDASADDVLKAYAKEIDDLKARGGYVTADVIDVSPEHPDLKRCSQSLIVNTGTMRTKFDL
jgi:1,2-dihydroxy-3-keto-5-methylthiopentene dioxygenase